MNAAGAHFAGYMRSAIKEGWLGIRVMQVMTSGTRYASLRYVYYTNLCKCRSFDGNRGLSGAARHCSEYLPGEVHLLNPELVVTFGRPAMIKTAGVLGLNLPSHSVRRLHASRFDLNGRVKMHIIFEHWGRRWGNRYQAEINRGFRQAVSRL